MPLSHARALRKNHHSLSHSDEKHTLVPELNDFIENMIECKSIYGLSVLARASSQSVQTPMTRAKHSIDYIELSVTDLNRSKAFYEKALGWSFTDYGPGYSGIKSQDPESELEMGGLAQADEVIRGSTMVILYSATLDESFEAVKSAGAEITKETYSFPGGKRFEFLDPDQNPLAIWCPE